MYQTPLDELPSTVEEGSRTPYPSRRSKPSGTSRPLGRLEWSTDEGLSLERTVPYLDALLTEPDHVDLDRQVVEVVVGADDERSVRLCSERDRVGVRQW
jgi:hypothetical protein